MTVTIAADHYTVQVDDKVVERGTPFLKVRKVLHETPDSDSCAWWKRRLPHVQVLNELVLLSTIQGASVHARGLHLQLLRSVLASANQR
jgi:hypothetical protein